MIQAALLLTGETASVDFKRSLDPGNQGEWLEVIKDVVALSNTGGGVILIGLEDDGAPSHCDVSAAGDIDSAVLTDKIHKYTGTHFHEFEITTAEKEGAAVVAIEIRRSAIPLVFTKVGTYEPTPGKQKNAFSVGTVYFRHGAKSEPCTSDDLRGCVERELDSRKKYWLEGIARVIEAPIGSRVTILPPAGDPTGPSGSVPLRLVNDPSAPSYFAVPIDQTHPYRQKEVAREVNQRLSGRRVINSHDLVCIRRAHNIQQNIVFCYTQNFVAPRYSPAFVDWIVEQYEKDPNFFEQARATYDVLKGKS
jgi:hypothetical protein